MSPFEDLYGRNCRTSLMWFDVGERSYFGLECIREAEEQVAKIRENLKAVQSIHKSYADNRRHDLAFEGDCVFESVTDKRNPQISSPRKVSP